MAFQFLDPEDLFTAYDDARKYMRPLFEPFQEFERIARNRPHPGIDKNLPKVTDGTMASIIGKTPRRIIQQRPTGQARSTGTNWLTIFASFCFEKKIIPNANAQYTFLQKNWQVVSKGLTYGSQPVLVEFRQNGKYFTTDIKLPYIRDVYLEKGKVSDEDSNYIMVDAWYQPRDIKNIIATQQRLQAKAAKRGETFESSWNLKALDEIKDFISQKDDWAVTPAERDKNNRSGGIRLTHVFQRGIGSTFYTIHHPTKKIVKTKKNPDLRGGIPIHYFYAEPDGSNPLGRGFVEAGGALQNLMDSEMQMYQLNRALMLNPPTIKRGDWNENQAKFAPNVLVDLGSSPNADWKVMDIDSSAIEHFPQNFGLMKAQLMQLLANPAANVSAQSGDPTMSKTQAGVQQQETIADIDDNYIRKQYEDWYEKVAETMINLYFSEKHGIEDIQLDEETADKIRDLMPDMVNEQDMLRVDWDAESEQLDFYVDPGSSEKKDDTQEIASLKEILADVGQNPYSLQYLTQAGKNLNLGEVYKQLYEKLGLKNLDKILTDLPKGQDGQPMAPPPMAMDKPQLKVNYPDLPPAAQIQMLRNAGINVDMNDLMQGILLDPNRQGRTDGQGQADIGNHPLIKLMTSLNIKFTDLPEDSKQEVLRIIGIPTQMVSPSGQQLQMQAIGQTHDILNSMAPQPEMGQANNPNAGPNGEAESPGQSPTPSAANNQPGLASPQTQQSSQPSAVSPQEDQAFADELRKHGIPEQQIGQAIAMLNSGMPAEDVLNMIMGVTSHG